MKKAVENMHAMISVLSDAVNLTPQDDLAVIAAAQTSLNGIVAVSSRTVVRCCAQ